MRMIAIDENCDARIHAMSLDSIRVNRLLALGCLAGSLLTASNKPACGQSRDGLSPAEVKMVRSVDAHADADLALLEKTCRPQQRNHAPGRRRSGERQPYAAVRIARFQSALGAHAVSRPHARGTSSPSILALAERASAERSCCSSATWIQSSNHPARFSSTRLSPILTARSPLVRASLT